MAKPKTAEQANRHGAPELVALGARIRELRTSAGLTQDHLATAAGINRVTLSKIERGIEDIGITRLLRLATVLEVDLADLFHHPDA